MRRLQGVDVPMTPGHVYLAVVEPYLPAGWLDGSSSSVRGAFHRPTFALAFSAAARRCGDAPLPLGPDAVDRVVEVGLDWLFNGLSLERAGRVALLVGADQALDRGEMVDLADSCFRRGDNRERAAVLSALSLLSEPARYVELATQACRSHVQTVFEALACDNPYPARFLPDAAFNQLVLKALFTGTALRRVTGLTGRVTPELTRMAHGYAAERRAAGRPVPEDIDELG